MPITKWSATCSWSLAGFSQFAWDTLEKPWLQSCTPEWIDRSISNCKLNKNHCTCPQWQQHEHQAFLMTDTLSPVHVASRESNRRFVTSCNSATVCVRRACLAVGPRGYVFLLFNGVLCLQGEMAALNSSTSLSGDVSSWSWSDFVKSWPIK